MPKFMINALLSIYQLQRSSNTESYGSSPAYTNINASITPDDTRIQVDYGGVPAFQYYKIFLFDITLQVRNGDKLVDTNGIEYIVDGMPFNANNQYLQFIKIAGKVKV